MWSIKKKHAIIIISTIIFIFCVNEYNPFEDVNNVKVLYSTSFKDNQQLTIFSPETLYINPLVKERIDSFSISAPGNIFWTDTTIKNDSVPFDQQYLFFVSFKDTGSNEIVITTYLLNTRLSKKITDQIYIHSPLSQKPISIYLGTECTLSTPGVNSEDVVYHWSFEDDVNLSGKSPQHSILFNTAPEQTDKCSLWVSDMQGVHTSPKIPFQAAFFDTVSPVILYKNFMGLFNQDTIYTGNTIFIFMTEIHDQGNSSVEKTWINSFPFEYYEPSKNLYWNIFDNSQMTYSHEPRQITVKAVDQYTNTITKDFWLYFDSTLEQNNIAFLTVDNADSEVVLNSSHWITGKVHNFSPDSLVLFNVVNGIDTIYRLYKIPPDSHMVTWKWNVELSEGENNVIIRLQKTSDNSVLIEKHLSVFLNNEVLDTIGPTILSIMVNDTLPYTGSEIFFQEDSVAISVVASDMNSEVDKILIDSTELLYLAQKQHWTNRFYISHNTKTNKLLSVYDVHSNKTMKYLNIFQNTKPKVLKNNLSQPSLFIGREYHDSISLLDMENDSLTVTYIKSAPWVTNGKHLYCKPTVNDTGQGSIVFTVSDGLQTTDTLIWYYAVSELPVSIEFDTIMIQSLFDTILAGTNQLSINLSAKNGILPYHYEILLSPVNTVLLDTSVDSSFLWTPILQDTGQYTLSFYIEDINHTKDTLLHPIYVKPNFQHITDLTMTIIPDTLPIINDTIDASNLNDSTPIVLNFSITSNSRGMFNITVHSQDSLVNQFEIDNNQFTIEKVKQKSIILETVTVKVTDNWNDFRTKNIYLRHNNPPDTSTFKLLPSEVAGCIWFDASDTMTVHCISGGKVRKWESKFPEDSIIFVSDDDDDKKPTYVSNPYVIKFDPEDDTYMEANSGCNFIKNNHHIIIVSMLNNDYNEKFFSLISFTESNYQVTYFIGYSHYYPSDLDFTFFTGYWNQIDKKENLQLYPSKGTFNIICATYSQSTETYNFSLNSKQSTESISCSFSWKDWNTLQLGGVNKQEYIRNVHDGSIAELIIIPRTLPADSLKGIEEYLTEKYGITFTP